MMTSFLGRSITQSLFIRGARSVRLFSSLDLHYVELPSLQQAAPANPPLIIVHGMLGSHVNWRTLAQKPELSLNRRVFAVDLRNHGESPHSSEMTLQANAEDLIHTMDRIGLDKAILLGHSLGGKCVMAAALTHPDRVEKLVVCDIAPYNYASITDSFETAQRVLELMQKLDLKQVTSRKDADQKMKELGLDDNVLRQFVLKNLTVDRSADVERYYWKCNVDILLKAMPQVRDFPYVPPTRPHPFPTLFVAGGASDYLHTPEHFAIAKSFFPKTKIAVIPNASHWLHMSHPNEFLAIVHKFITAK